MKEGVFFFVKRTSRLELGPGAFKLETALDHFDNVNSVKEVFDEGIRYPSAHTKLPMPVRLASGGHGRFSVVNWTTTL